MMIRAHFDGRFLVPDEPVNLPRNETLHIEIRRVGDQLRSLDGDAVKSYDSAEMGRRLEAMKSMMAARLSATATRSGAGATRSGATATRSGAGSTRSGVRIQLSLKPRRS